MSVKRPINDIRFDVKLVTKQEEYATPTSVYQLNGSTSSLDLNNLINTLLDDANEDWSQTDFDFILDGHIIRQTIIDHLEELSRDEPVTGEKQLEVEYIVKEKAPSPKSSLLHDDWVSSVDSNAKYIISGTYDGFVHIWTLKGKHLIAIPGNHHPIKAVRWIDLSRIPDDASIPSFGDNDYGYVFGSHDEVVHVMKWNSKTNKVEIVFSCRGHQRSVDCVDVNGDLFASGSYDKLLKIWSLEVADEDTGAENGKPTIKGGKKKLKSNNTSWNKTKVPVLTLSGHSEAITDLTWLSNKESKDVAPEVATCSMDNTIRIWDIETSEAKQTLPSSKAFLNIAYSPLNNLILSGSSDRHIRLWDPRSESGSNVIQTFSTHRAWISSVAWSPVSDKHFISGSYDNEVKHWDIRSPKASLYDLIGHKDKVLCVNWSNQAYMISGAADNQLKIFSA